MTIHQSLRRLFRPLTPRRAPRADRLRHRPALECLEGRTVPTTLVVRGDQAGPGFADGSDLDEDGAGGVRVVVNGEESLYKPGTVTAVSVQSGGGADVSATVKTLQGPLVNAGTMTWEAGRLHAAARAVLDNQPGAIFELRGGTTFEGQSAFVNTGTVQVAAGAGVSRFEAAAFANDGVVEVHSGTLSVGGPAAAPASSRWPRAPPWSSAAAHTRWRPPRSRTPKAACNSARPPASPWRAATTSPRR